MYGGPGTPISEEQRKAQIQQTNDTLKLAGVIAGTLWVTPVIFHFIQRQLN